MAAEIALDIQIGVEAQHRDVEIAVSKRRKYLTMEIGKSTTPAKEYPGPYTVQPRLYYGTVLETKGFLMRDDIGVEPIAMYEVSNPQGGRTVTIGTI